MSKSDRSEATPPRGQTPGGRRPGIAKYLSSASRLVGAIATLGEAVMRLARVIAQLARIFGL